MPSAIDEIRLVLETLEQDSALYEQTNFVRRVQAVDDIEFNILGRIEGLGGAEVSPEELGALKRRAVRIQSRLLEIDRGLFEMLRGEIQRGDCRGARLKSRIEEYAGSGGLHDQAGYDSLDVFVKGLLLHNPIPEETKEREPGMVYYQPTPARVILELVERAELSEQDVFYDIGSGLGQVPILVNLLTGAGAKGVEYEPVFCDYARARAAELNISRVEFVNADARSVDYADGSSFFMYTPFEGAMLDQVLRRLREQLSGRRVSLFTYGPCTRSVSQQGWLEHVDVEPDNPFRLSVFASRSG